MKPIFRYILIISVMLLANCSKVTNSIEEININPDQTTFPNIDIVVDEIIPLETNEKSLIGEVRMVKYFNENFYVFDKYQTQSLYYFDSNGRFVTKKPKQRNAKSLSVSFLRLPYITIKY